MNFKKEFLKFLLIITGLLIQVFLIVSITKNYPHTRKGECNRCHLNEPPEKTEEKKMLFVKDIDSLCEDCHQLSRATSHPTGIIPSMRIPKDFTLDWMGRLTCATCHDIHQEKEKNPYPYLLRRPTAGRLFCISCHRELPGEEKFSQHKLAIELAHLEPKYYITDNRSPIDSLSRKCLSCHDGTIGKMADNVIVGAGKWQHGPGIGITHPIGVDYELAYIRNSEGLNPPESLNPAIKLFDGKVGCCSCHNPFSEHPNYLVMDNTGSALCLECHRK
ncbi:cytochrome c3 family protein [SCandidatus Aminicenantes bacterium Aminicenantia_JdfR_composite]|jgi:predicted CXXCH cytochrome family protein|nr:cytochrome c3 family protein [SCandidatus Aminicenantes bacterium Aminicenantia_JdfR_composite]